MIVWAGCKACKDQNVLVGRWVEESELPHLDPVAMHQLEAYDVVVTGAHAEPLVGYDIESWGVSAQMDPEHVRLTAELMDALTLHGYDYPAWVMAAWFTGQEVYDMPVAHYKALFAGLWAGKPTRALRKRYSLTTAGPGYHYMWRTA